VVIDGDAIAVRSMMNLCLSFDHRVLDGVSAARFLQGVRRWLEGFSEQVPLY
jgi:pyruvate/2-oxoglutarate dehydrogenase complex dihydrolipoamide acyltransferase (E2) component